MSFRNLAYSHVACVLLSLWGTVAAGHADPHDPMDFSGGISARQSAPEQITVQTDSAGTQFRVVAPDSTAAAIEFTSVPEAEKRALWKRPFYDGANMLKILGLDTWYIVSSPARIDKRGALITAATLGITAVLYNNDEAISRAIARNRNEEPLETILDVGYAVEPIGLMGDMNKYYLGAMLYGYAFDIEPVRVVPAQILESHIIAGGLRNILKPLVGRAHPYEGKGPNSFEFGEGTSFPSGHTSVVFELATIFSHHIDYLPVTIACFGAATAVAIQRVDSGNHWASDVLIPAVTGTFIAKTICRRRDERRQMAFFPLVRPDGVVGIQVSRGF